MSISGECADDARLRSMSSNSIIPVTMEATKTRPLISPAPNATRPGPGQNPAMPQPIPNIMLPITRRFSIRSLPGNLMLKPRNDSVRLRATVKATRPTMMAPPMTNARDGSHNPAISRKPRTFSGLAIPDTIRPKPKTRPAKREAKENFMASGSEQVANDENADKAGRHKTQGGDERA